jgi:hypothetical protein
MLIDFDHGVTEVERPIRQQGIYKRDVRVGHNVWIGYGACILRGVTVGDNSVIGTSAVVTQGRARKRRRRRGAGARDPHARGAAVDALGVSAPALSPALQFYSGTSSEARLGVHGEVAQRGRIGLRAGDERSLERQAMPLEPLPGVRHCDLTRDHERPVAGL